jgi:hypothetical protein
MEFDESSLGAILETLVPSYHDITLLKPITTFNGCAEVGSLVDNTSTIKGGPYLIRKG